ncbi:hypothetical protein ACD578_05255 [Microvirga sp. RSM25]|uniref:hypothetical protein n=1 Tax=Microvirga sp. RSM25 TaxID=3273802 RepID=UPI003850FB6C
MAQVMREREAADGACQSNHLRAAGFTEAEIWAYADDARALLSGRKLPARIPPSAARRESTILIAQARKIRGRIHAAQEVSHG